MPVHFFSHHFIILHHCFSSYHFEVLEKEKREDVENKISIIIHIFERIIGVMRKMLIGGVSFLISSN